ncbi:hypothetical protein BDV36DRAFT_299278 [Aspergillus pseudocaelatus]|uniref:Zn(2)-C6 fungal-type domain-containing protein n=1 Tax=Aspergillus pseudocaelatus TaxID=1825620 RepID=A0ABQ6WAL2_9EURO|nr:hypothetical protein BDV36DRAFT_299278 [Aspergillus pseudocaelatus]
MTNHEPPGSAVRRLRDTFGDPKPPDITRKITACVACRKQKIKCHMNESQPPCARCRKKGLPCTVNRSLQMLLENDAVWKQNIEQKIQALEAAVSRNVNNNIPLDLPQRNEQGLENEPSSVGEEVVEGNQQDTTSERPGRWKITIDLESNPGALPGHYLLRANSVPANTPTDMISRGVISTENALRYFDEYQNRLDHFVYRILGDHSTATLGRIREVSPLLTTAICAVGALHLSSSDFEALYKEFVALSAPLSFSRRHTVDDVRALCIGAFWLSDLSWSLVGLTVRITTELQLHKSFSKALQGDRNHYSRARLYLLVYACDHHFSVPYGRPPMTRECEAVRDARKFLDCTYATEDDARLVSQVLRWSICTNMYDTFGSDVDRPLSDADISQVRRFSIALDSLRAEWGDKFKQNAHVGNYPRKGVGIQYHFAKLYLCSHALRGAGSRHAKSRAPDVVLEFEEIANSAVLSAVSILRAVISDPEIQSYLNGLPTYFDIMIAFAVVFLLKVSTRFSATVHLDNQETQRLMLSLVTVLKGVTASMHPHHLLVSITKGIDDLLQRSRMAPSAAQAVPMDLLQQEPQQIIYDRKTPHVDFGLENDGLFDQYLMSEFDFLSEQDPESLIRMSPR